MRPQYDLWLMTLESEVFYQKVQRLRHMRIAEIPGGYTPTKHRAVVLFGVLHQPGVLFGIEEIVGGNAPVAARVFRWLAVAGR